MASVSHRGSSSSSELVFRTSDFGLVGDGVTDNRTKLQKAIDTAYKAGGGVVYIDVPGTYIVTANSTLGYCLLLKHKVELRGVNRDTVILKQAPSIAASTRLIYTNYQTSTHHYQTLRTLTLDGNKASQTVNEHRHGLYAGWSTRGVRVEDVTAKNFTGDGLYFHDTTDCRLHNVRCTLNDRNGFTMGGRVASPRITGSLFDANAVQGIDSEPPTGSPITNCWVIGNVIYSNLSNLSAESAAITLGGNYASPTFDLSRGYVIRGNTIYGRVHCVGVRDSLISGNTIYNHTNGSGIIFYRTCWGMKARGNTIYATAPTNVWGGIAIQGVMEAFEDIPIDCSAEYNRIYTVSADSYGLQAESCRNATFRYNYCENTSGQSSLYGTGLRARATVASPEMFQDLVAEYNTFKNFGNSGAAIGGNTQFVANDAKIQRVRLKGNRFIDDQAVPTMTTGILWTDFYQPIVYAEGLDNEFEGITTEQAYPTYAPIVVELTSSGKPVYMTPSAPEGFIAADQGAIAMHRVAGVVTATYEKRIQGGNTGWVAI